MKLALLSNVTIDLLAGMLKKNVDVYLSAGFDTWQQEMIMPTSGLYEFAPDAVALLLYADAYENVWDSMDSGCQVIDEWIQAIQALSAKLPGIPVFVSSIDIFGVKARYGAEVRFEQYFENYLIEHIEKLHADGHNVYILPVKDKIINIGRSKFYSSKMWYVGSMPYSMKGLSELNDLILRYIGVTKGMHKKCIAVDLDNTLWGGVIGEDGVNGIVLSGHKEGARYKDTQRILKKMKDQGVMLAILSKNNVDDVEPVFKHPDMVLQHEDFVAEAINWEPKAVNIRQLAADLNIGLDAFVFLDDNPAEREAMMEACPEVAVLDFPKDTSLLPEVVEKAYEEYFLSLEVTGEDTKKTAMYRAENQRRAEMSTAVSMDDYLKRLEMTMDIHIMRPEEEKRVTQLANKTNQFNVTTRRYSEEEIHSFAVSENSDVITVHMADKYGEQGLVSVLILKYEGDEAEIDTFLMSCRVMGRNAEIEIISRIRQLLEGKDIQTVHATYLKTAKNAPVAGLFEKLGFTNFLDSDEKKEYKTSTESLPDNTGLFKEVNCDL